MEHRWSVNVWLLFICVIQTTFVIGSGFRIVDASLPRAAVELGDVGSDLDNEDAAAAVVRRGSPSFRLGRRSAIDDDLDGLRQLHELVRRSSPSFRLGKRRLVDVAAAVLPGDIDGEDRSYTDDDDDIDDHVTRVGRSSPSFRLGKRLFPAAAAAADVIDKRDPTFRLGKRDPTFRLGRRSSSPSFRLGKRSVTDQSLRLHSQQQQRQPVFVLPFYFRQLDAGYFRSPAADDDVIYRTAPLDGGVTSLTTADEQQLLRQATSDDVDDEATATKRSSPSFRLGRRPVADTDDSRRRQMTSSSSEEKRSVSFRLGKRSVDE